MTTTTTIGDGVQMEGGGEGQGFEGVRRGNEEKVEGCSSEGRRWDE
eukprot:CAMPEP_0119345694 /NCGR_PEP_ID=MMETSP1333-20130426/107498_1 /TAXON_ID=418940 /ORGANISM="Scyphosphaera apsteinii, Strain RCC1455" /LENGTH=45 /DNA_ID= /DNA_START= /DNA_END= /DNA_ORIENTATION=